MRRCVQGALAGCWRFERTVCGGRPFRPSLSSRAGGRPTGTHPRGSARWSAHAPPPSPHGAVVRAIPGCYSLVLRLGSSLVLHRLTEGVSREKLSLGLEVDFRMR
jgi:hypothetical protein